MAKQHQFSHANDNVCG